MKEVNIILVENDIKDLQTIMDNAKAYADTHNLKAVFNAVTRIKAKLEGKTIEKRGYKTIYTQLEFVKAIQDYSIFPTRALYNKLCHYREQCLRYLKNNPNDFDKQLDLIDLNHMGIPDKKPLINRGPKPKIDSTSICAKCSIPTIDGGGCTTFCNGKRFNRIRP